MAAWSSVAMNALAKVGEDAGSLAGHIDGEAKE
jgi:hypothetical protein